MRTSSFLLGFSLTLIHGGAVAAPTVKAASSQATLSPISIERANAHRFRATNFSSVTSDAGLNTPLTQSLLEAQNGSFDVTQFSTKVKAILEDKVRGYAMQVRKNGNAIASQTWGLARAPGDGNKAFWTGTRMHIASLSKLIAAIGTVKALNDQALSFDTKIGAYLPAYWTVGSNVANITFRQLLTHKSGFNVAPVNGDCGCSGDYKTMKAVVAAGVNATPPAEGNYENVNFSILRVIVPILTGAVSRGTSYRMSKVSATALQSDAIWDITTTEAFMSYMQAKVFTPAGVVGVSTIPNSDGALAYGSPTDNDGLDTGDTSTQLGGVGFRISVSEALKVMDAFCRKGTIVPAAKAQQAISANLGIDWELTTPGGTMRFKNGGWGWDGRAEQTIAFFLPDDTEVAVFTNTRLPSDASFTAAIRDAVLNSFRSQEPTAAPSKAKAK